MCDARGEDMVWSLETFCQLRGAADLYIYLSEGFRRCTTRDQGPIICRNDGGEDQLQRGARFDPAQVDPPTYSCWVQTSVYHTLSALQTSYCTSHYAHALYPVMTLQGPRSPNHCPSRNRARPMTSRLISLVPAPISYSLASRSRRPVGYSLT